jgi:hypothetical protein
VDAIRRRQTMAVDSVFAAASNWLAPTRTVPLDGRARFAVVTVNFSTTEYLKLMLLTLSDQDRLSELLGRIVIVDNDSRDGGSSFVKELNRAVPNLVAVNRRHWLHHGPAMRAGVRALDRTDAFDPLASNVLLFCDPDVIFRNPDTLAHIAGAFEDGAALVGEPRVSAREGPDIQASFYAVRREIYARADVAPLVHGGAPAYRQQVSVSRLGLPIMAFPSNYGGFILHRGRSGVAASRIYYRNHPYATVSTREPHFMGVADGEAIWHAVQERYSTLLEPTNEAGLIEHLASILRMNH